MSKREVAIGFRTLRGGAVVVGVAVDGAGPRVVLATFLSTAAEGDRLSLEPYHVAAEMPRLKDGGASAAAKTAVATGRKRQDALALKGLTAIIAELKGQGLAPASVCLLVNRAGWMNDLLAYSLMDPGHPPVAEGLAVREALRAAFAKARLNVAEMDEKSLPAIASEMLGLTPGTINAQLKDFGASAGRPWRKEQKLACLAAWVDCQAKQ